MAKIIKEEMPKERIAIGVKEAEALQKEGYPLLSVTKDSRGKVFRFGEKK